jgi:hypothetical protein
MSVFGRIRDFFHEIEIVRLRLVYDSSARNWHVPANQVQAIWNAYVRAVDARSPEQVIRMRKRNGVRY